MWWAWLACSAADRGDRAFEQGDWEQAVSRYQEAVGLTDTQAQRLARSCLKLDRPDCADEALRGVTDLDANGALVRCVLTQDLADCALDEPSLSSPALQVNACLLALTQDKRWAPGLCEAAMLAAPLDPLPRLAAAELALDEGMRPAALKLLESVGSLELGDSELAWTMALWQRAGLPLEACQLGKGRRAEGLGLGAACLAAGDPAGEDILEELGTPEARVLLLRLSLARAEAARPGPERSLELDKAESLLRGLGPLSETSGVLTDRGRLRRLQGREDDAIALFAQALAQDPEELAPRLNLSRLHHQRGDSAAALLVLMQAPELDPVESLALELEVAQLRSATGDLETAALLELLERCEKAGQRQCAAETTFLLAMHAESDEVGVAWLDRALELGGLVMGRRALAEPRLLELVASPAAVAWERDPALREIRAQASAMAGGAR
ncbi:MAG: tetratricopeptide repeat protein [Myxococcota bacterium]|nr:tetratricopeptide repeat protein [Myxococcota bacterium]